VVETASAQKNNPLKTRSVEQISRDIIQSRMANRGLGNTDELVIKDIIFDDVNYSHVKFRQTVDNIPVWGGEAIVHLRGDKSLFAVTDELLSDISVNTEPNFSEKQIYQTALGMYRGSLFLTADPQIDMWIFRGTDRDHLVYRVQLRREDGSQNTAMPVIFIDAQTGEKVFEYNNLQTASGTSLYSGTVTINTSNVGSTYYMEDLTRKIGTFDNRNTTGSTYRFTDTNNIWNSTSQKAGVDAHYGAGKVYDYFKNTHGRTGIDGSGGPGYYSAAANSSIGLISSKVHYGSNYNNAFWNGSYMTYGDGNGTTFSPLVTMDICGHEMTHGITERTAGLVYSNQSGALNESVSDIFGAMVERYADGNVTSSNTWKIGEDAYTPGTSGDALRNMSNTHSSGDPDHYSERYTGTADNGGVHTNSGIPNYAFYLLSQGGTHHLGGSMTGIGPDKAARIWFKALTTYMTSSTTFAGARTATLNAAASIYGTGSTEYNAVANSWTLVGV
jgi:thermolysin